LEGENSLDRNDAMISSLLTEEYAYFYRIAYSYVRNEADAQDIVQEAAYKAVYHSGKLKQPEFARTWLTRIVINEALSFLRKHKREVLPIEAENETAAPENPVSKEESFDLKEAVNKLPPEEKTLILLRFFEDKKLEEIAEICGEALSTIKSRFYRTLKKLKLDLETEQE
jgi:RNA polymerase sigma-70 factor (ECF subfamily)